MLRFYSNDKGIMKQIIAEKKNRRVQLTFDELSMVMVNYTLDQITSSKD